MDSEPATLSQYGSTPQWVAPEVLDEGPYSKEADIFSFAMVMIEVCYGRPTVCKNSAHSHSEPTQVFTGAIPFSGSNSTAAMSAICRGERPSRPTHPALTENLWTLMQRCWDHDPYSRPEVSEVLQVLLTPSVSHSFCRSSVC